MRKSHKGSANSSRATTRSTADSIKNGKESVPAKPLNLYELNSILSRNIVLLDQDQSTPEKLNAMANATGKVINGWKLYLEYCRRTGKNPDNRLIGEPEMIGPEIPNTRTSAPKAA